MRIESAMRRAALAALLATAWPVPVSAQLGGIKRKLKEKINMGAIVRPLCGQGWPPLEAGT